MFCILGPSTSSTELTPPACVPTVPSVSATTDDLPGKLIADCIAEHSDDSEINNYVVP